MKFRRRAALVVLVVACVWAVGVAAAFAQPRSGGTGQLAEGCARTDGKPCDLRLLSTSDTVVVVMEPPAPVRFTESVGVAPFQNPVNPNTVEFAASSDHAVQQNGVDKLTSYVVEVYASATATATLATRDIGKPTPSGGLVTYSQLATLLATVPAGQNYVVKIASVGPGGTSRSNASNPFNVTPTAPAASGTPVVR